MTKIADRCIASNHPALAGHFPGNPIVPGVLLLSEVLLAIERHLGLSAGVCSWPVVKFVAPLRPGEPFAINIERKEQDRFAFSVTRGGTTIASGKLSPQGALRADVAP